MEFVSATEIGISSTNIWKMLPKVQEVVITNEGKPIALLTPLSSNTFEETISAVRKAKAMNAVKLIQQSSLRQNKNNMTLEEINNEISKARKQMTK
jgi:antitoxin (DNA-binding transcriptional repressor) of toxin-antitoxin stability system